MTTDATIINPLIRQHQQTGIYSWSVDTIPRPLSILFRKYKHHLITWRSAPKSTFRAAQWTSRTTQTSAFLPSSMPWVSLLTRGSAVARATRNEGSTQKKGRELGQYFHRWTKALGGISAWLSWGFLSTTFFYEWNNAMWSCVFHFIHFYFHDLSLCACLFPSVSPLSPLSLLDPAVTIIALLLPSSSSSLPSTRHPHHYHYHHQQYYIITVIVIVTYYHHCYYPCHHCISVPFMMLFCSDSYFNCPIIIMIVNIIIFIITITVYVLSIWRGLVILVSITEKNIIILNSHYCRIKNH